MPEKAKWKDILVKSLKISGNRAMELAKIATIKSEIYLHDMKINQSYKKLGQKIYILLKQGKEINEILKTIQPCINDIEKIEEKIEAEKEKIEHLKRELKLSESEKSIIDEITTKKNSF